MASPLPSIFFLQIYLQSNSMIMYPSPVNDDGANDEHGLEGEALKVDTEWRLLSSRAIDHYSDFLDNNQPDLACAQLQFFIALNGWRTGSYSHTGLAPKTGSVCVGLLAAN